MELLQNDGVLFTLKIVRFRTSYARCIAASGRTFLIFSTTALVATHCTASGKAASFEGCLHQALTRVLAGDTQKRSLLRGLTGKWLSTDSYVCYYVYATPHP